MSLGNILARLYPEARDARRLCDQIDMDTSRIDFGGSAINFWQATLIEVDKQDKTVELLYEVSWEYPNNVEFLQQQAGYLRDMLQMGRNADSLVPGGMDLDKRLRSLEMQVSILISFIVIFIVSTLVIFWV